MQGKSNVRSLLLAAISLVAGGCGAATPPPADPGIAPKTSSSQPSLPAGANQVVENSPLPFELSLPTPQSWQHTFHPGQVLVRHEATSTEIELRYWKTSRLVAPPQCQEELEQMAPEASKRRRLLASVDPLTTIDFLPGGDYRGGLFSKVTRDEGGPITGWVHGIAVGLGHCLSFDAKTTAVGIGAQSEIGARLTLLLNGIAASIRWREISQRVEPVRP